MEATKTKTTGAGLVPYDMVRVTTEAHYSSALFCLGPHDRTLFYKHELIRLCDQNDDLYFAVPYLADPDDEKKVARNYIMARQFRELNPAERASLGLPLFGGWDLVTRYGLEGARRAARAKAREMDAHGDGWGAERYSKGVDLLPDKESDPRNFTIGELRVRGLDGLPAAKRELHPWPVVYTVTQRFAGEGDDAWRPVVRFGKPMTALAADHWRALMTELHNVEMQGRLDAHAADRNFRQTEFRTTAGVALPTPYESREKPV